jgi:hypothetical protein
VKIFGREPALWGALLASIIYVLGAFVLPFTTDQESLLIAVVSAVIGVVVAVGTRDGWSAAALGLVKSVLALALGFGLHWSPEQQAVALTLAAALVGVFVRTQATAPIPASQAP